MKEDLVTVAGTSLSEIEQEDEECPCGWYMDCCHRY